MEIAGRRGGRLGRAAVIAGALLVLLLVSGAASAEPEPTAQQIVDRMLERNRMGFDTGLARVRMVLRARDGSTRNRLMEVRGDMQGGLRRSRVEFLEPADVKGSALLLLEQRGSADLQYLYLPALKKVRRIAGSARSSSFMGSDFSYGDLESRDARDGRKERLADEAVSGQDAFRVRVVPDEGDYGQVDLWVHKTLFLPLRMEFTDHDGKLQKSMKSRQIEKKDDRWVITRLTMATVPAGTETELVVESMEPGATFPDSVFDKSTLAR